MRSIFAAIVVCAAVAPAHAQLGQIGTPGPIPGTVYCAITDMACRQHNPDVTCFSYGLRQGTSGWAKCQQGLAAQGEQNARLLAYLQAQQQMQDFGNRLQSAAG
jgi:hypothetical protein